MTDPDLVGPASVGIQRSAVPDESRRPAGLLRRAVAMVADWFIVSLLYLGFLIVGIWGATLGARSAGARFFSTDLAQALTGPVMVLWVALAWVYIGWFTRHGGQTPGKILMRIRVLSLDGREPTWSQALLRPLGYLISWIPLGIGFLLAAFPPAKRALHDHLTGTMVVRTSSQVRRVPLTFMTTACLSVMVASPGSAVLVERIMASVNDAPVTLSDVVAYQSLSGDADPSAEHTVRALVDRRLLLLEADRFAIPIPDATDIAARVSAFAFALGGPDALATTLDRLGWSRDDLKAWVVDELRVTDFLNQRIYFFVIVTPQEIDEYLDAHAEEFADIPADDARNLVEMRLVKSRGDAKRDEFIRGLRAKAIIRINPID